ncbi:MAG: putative Ig domain-containing protein, partial [Thermoplasmata archaeon]|nr:putative Ig domain-containing protein [Thermoplasmata archaeon]
GTYWVNVIVDDGNGGFYSTNFTLTVFNVNDDPVITTTQISKAANEDLLYTIDFDAEDIDPTGDSLTWLVVTNAGWLNIDSTTGVLSGTPSNDDIDLYDVNISVDDGNGGVDFVFYTLNVVNVNDPPSITTTDLKIATEDELYTVDYEGIDIDPTADILTWTLTTNAIWLEINSITGILMGTPLNDDVGEYWVNVSVNDGNGDNDWSNFSLTVNNVNDPPNISTVDVNVANVNELYSVDYNAIDIDPTNDILTWLLTTNASKWLTINPISGVLSGTPTPSDMGEYWVNVTVNDGNGGSDWHYFILMVKLIPIFNQNPVINTADITTTPVDKLYSVKYQATDDRTPFEKLEWSMETNASWLSFDTLTRILSGTPTDNDVGIYWINISVDDREGGMSFTNFMLEVIKIVPKN